MDSPVDVAPGDTLVLQFDHWHQAGDFCGARCSRTGNRLVTVDHGGDRAPEETPLYILSEATKADWIRYNRLRGCASQPSYDYFYFVSTD